MAHNIFIARLPWEQIAYQKNAHLSGANKEVIWVYRNPVINTNLEHNRLNINGEPLDWNHADDVTDPTGAMVTPYDPGSLPQVSTDPLIGPIRIGSIDDFKICPLDGIIFNCSSLMNLLNNGWPYKEPTWDDLRTPPFNGIPSSISWRGLGDSLFRVLQPPGIVDVDPRTPPFAGFLPAPQNQGLILPPVGLIQRIANWFSKASDRKKAARFFANVWAKEHPGSGFDPNQYSDEELLELFNNGAFSKTANDRLDPLQILGIIRVFRGGPTLTARDIDVKIDKQTGLLEPGRGVSINTDPSTLERFGGAYEIQMDSVPPELEVIQRGVNKPSHYEIVPRDPMTFTRYQQLLNKIKLTKVTP